MTSPRKCSSRRSPCSKSKAAVDDLYAEVGEGIVNRNQVYDAVFHTRKSEDRMG